MHFSNAYAQLILGLPSEHQGHAIQYCKFKELIDEVVLELSSIGLSPPVLHELLESSTNYAGLSLSAEFPLWVNRSSRVLYEFQKKSGEIEPRLRLFIDSTLSHVYSERDVDGDEEVPNPKTFDSEIDPRFFLALQLPKEQGSGLIVNLRHVAEHENLSHLASVTDANSSVFPSGGIANEVVVPLVSDKAFFQALSDDLALISPHLETVHSDFVRTLHALSRTIGDSARPSSSTSLFQPYSFSHPRLICMPSVGNKNDLYAWREIFRLYMEAEVFESMGETSRGALTVEESERRLKLFAARISQRGLAELGHGHQLNLKQSHDALETFLGMNLLILNIRKFQLANLEATKKILKKHAKKTALPELFFAKDGSQISPLAILPPANMSLSRTLAQAIVDLLMPIIPHLNDYSCLICTGVAFKPIRLNCRHVFCVRCLVKIQKQGTDPCPMCRKPCVLRANKANVDWALLNFIQDWFPVEVKEKLKLDEEEAAKEDLIELGLDPNQRCLVM